MKLLPWEYGLRNLGRSRTRWLLCALGGMLVVLLMLAAGAFARGLDRALIGTAGAHNVLVLGAGSEESLERSEIDANTPGLILASVPGIRRRMGVNYISPEVQMQTVLRLREHDPEELTAVFRGVAPEAFLVHDRARLIEGRLAEAGRDEVMVGALAASKLGVDAASLAVGSTIWFDRRTWTIVGRFEVRGSVMDAEIWCPLRDLQITARRNNLSCVVMTLDDAEFEDVDAFCKRRLDLELTALRESDYYASLARFYGPVRIMVWVTALLIALAGLLGGFNTMYAAFASRVREIGALQTLGYSRRAVVLSLTQESVLAAACGALPGAILGRWLLDGMAVRFSAGAFNLAVDSTVLVVGLLAGLALGVLGAIPPAIRCLRLPISIALKANV